MPDQWVILELSSKAEGEDPDLVKRSISFLVRGAEVFIPAAVTQLGEDRVVHYLVDGYAFIRHKHPDASYSRLDNSKYVQRVLTEITRLGGGRPTRKLSFISDVDIEKMRRQIHAETDQGISVDDKVLITSGPYRQITARVIEEIPEEQKVQVHIQLRSKDSIITLPRSFLRLVERAPKPTCVSDFTRSKSWFNTIHDEAVTIVSWENRYLSIQDAHKTFASMNSWVSDMQFVRSFYTPLDLSPIMSKETEANLLAGWTTRLGHITPIVQSCSYTSKTTAPLRKKYIEWSWLQGMQRKLDRLRDDVIAIERQMDAKRMGTQNVIVDGFNLAFRVFYAPGMADLRDTKNRPSGVIYGFLRSLTALGKRFPGAHIYVTWDGSNRTRKAKYEGYKATRNPNPLGPGGWDQVTWLRSVLPLLGIAQAFNPQEEADDVIASLVRGPLKGQNNVFLSSDRDLLQLVTATDHLLAPAQGKRKETLYDVSTLEKEWEVPPHKMVMLRSLLGDTSDNLPGVPTVPEKILVGLVNAYKNLDGIFLSNLAGLTKLRYERLRASEKQVRLNYEIMSLRDVSYEEVPADPNPKLVTERLTDVDVNVDPILAVFFGEKTAVGTNTCQQGVPHGKRLRDPGRSGRVGQPLRVQRGSVR